MTLPAIVPVYNEATTIYEVLRCVADVPIPPALKGLYGAIDKAIHHYRRYDRAEIIEKLERARLRVETAQFFNLAGVPGWYLNSCLLKRKTVPGIQARVNSLLVPLP